MDGFSKFRDCNITQRKSFEIIYCISYQNVKANVLHITYNDILALLLVKFMYVAEKVKWTFYPVILVGSVVIGLWKAPPKLFSVEEGFLVHVISGFRTFENTEERKRSRQGGRIRTCTNTVTYKPYIYVY